MRRPIPEHIIEPSLSEYIKAIEKDGAEAITLGCGAFLGMADELDRLLKNHEFEVL